MKIKNTILFVATICGLVLGLEAVCRAQNVQTVPLYRLLYSESSLSAEQRQHFYTTNKTERDAALRNYNNKAPSEKGFPTMSGFKDEGIEGYISPKQMPGTVPLYRLYKEVQRHFYTTDAKEKDNAVQKLGWTLEGIVGYVWKTQIPGTTPLFRLYRPEKGNIREDHFYTVSEDGKFTAIQAAGYSFIKDECYVMAKQETLNDATGAIYNAQQNTANKTAQRKDEIIASYLQSMGRNPTDAEMNYWLPRSETKPQIDAAARNWLWSPAGAKDLRETLDRAAQQAYKKKYTDAEINYLIEGAKAQKMVYQEMVKWLASAKKN